MRKEREFTELSFPGQFAEILLGLLVMKYAPIVTVVGFGMFLDGATGGHVASWLGDKLAHLDGNTPDK